MQHPQRTIRLLLVGALITWLLPARGGSAAEPLTGELVAALGHDCPAGHGFRGLPIRSVDVVTPLTYLPWVRADLAKARDLARPLVGTNFERSKAKEVSEKIAELPFARVDMEARVGARALDYAVTCSPQGIDITFSIFAMNVSPHLGISWEARKDEIVAPERQAGYDRASGLRFQPELGYRTGDGGGVGGSLQYKRSDDRSGVWHTLNLDGYRSEGLRRASLALEGSRQSAQATWPNLYWRLRYLDDSAPIQSVSRLEERSLAAQVVAQTRPIGFLEMPVRLGAELSTGDIRGGTRNSAVAFSNVDQRFRSLKMMSGTTARLERQSFAATYAVEYGATNGTDGSDWVKQIADFAHESRWPVADHRSLSLDSRLTFGHLRESGKPVPNARFFAGGREQRFVEGDGWQVRSAPLLRSLGTNALAGNNASPGYTRFSAVSLTAALPVFNVPLVPPELYKSVEARGSIDFYLDSAQAIFETDAQTNQPSYQQAIARLTQVRQALAALRWGGDDGSADGGAPKCRPEISRAIDDITDALNDTGIGQLGFLPNLVPGEGSPNTLGKLVSCLSRDDLPPSQQIQQLLKMLQSSIASLQRGLDSTLPKRVALREIAPARHIINTLMDDINAVSVSPMLMMDAVTLGPRLSGPSSRVGVGPGIRITFVNSVDLSAGYMVNVRRQPGEPRGAFFLTFDFKDPF